jgi:hypothetical protein
MKLANNNKPCINLNTDYDNKTISEAGTNKFLGLKFIIT